MSLYELAADIVLAALDLAPEARAAYIERVSGHDPALHDEVTSLLDAHSRAGEFLETPAAALLDTDEAPFTEGARVGAYRILGLLGEGGMGIVYLAEDTRLGRTVALKCIHARFSDNDAWRDRLRREARAAAALTHPGVATVYALEEIDGRLLLATEHVAGETLRDFLGRGPVDAATARDLGRQLADAVAAAHDRGVVHRDLKPENVMRTPDGAVKILDFGLARLAAGVLNDDAAYLTQDGAVFGTPAYMSPEQLRGESAGPSADIFALGVILAELATGRHPFAPAAGSNPAATMARLLTAEPDLEGAPPSLAAVIRTCLAKSPTSRFGSARELRRALDNPGAPVSATAGTPSGALWWWQFDLAAVSVFSIALALAVWALRESLSGPAGPPMVLLTIVSALAATTLRLHLWFTARVYVADAAAQHRRVMPWIKITSGVEAASVAAAGLHLPEAHSIATALLVSSAVVLLLASLVIGPATARTARLT